MQVISCLKEHNLQKAIKMAYDAVKLGAKIIVLPEVFSTGFCYEKLDNIAEFPPFSTLKELKNFSFFNNCVLIGSLIEKRFIEGKIRYYNLGFCIENGEVIGYYRKSHLFQKESNYFTAGEIINPFLLNKYNITIGLQICYELRFPEIARKLALNKSDILITIAQFPNPRQQVWKSLIVARAIENQVPHIACNIVGISDNLSFFGSSMIVDASGSILAEANSDESILVHDIDLSNIIKVRSEISIFSDRKPYIY